MSKPASAPFSEVSFDRERFRADMQKSGARKSYAIFFTPRSGSSWLTDVIRQTGCLGEPEEWFNPSFIPRTAQWVNADNIMNYVKMLKRKKAPGRIFGFEITYYQMLATFGSEADFLSHFLPGMKSFFLVREDIVLQAVSLAKSVETSVYHSAHSVVEEIHRADQAFQYDPRRIEHWLAHILDQELRFETFFTAHGMTPMRISYEQMISMGREEVVSLFAARMGEEVGEIRAFDERHKKIGTEKNEEFAARFAKENPRFLRAVSQRRERTLQALHGTAGTPVLCASAEP